jgi:MOSC domain-containing protein YiiM
VHIIGLYAGHPQPLGPRGSLSSIVKHPVTELTVNTDGTDEDQQANLRLHGGPEKVLHQYSTASYAILINHFPELASYAEPGSIGENISVPDMHDTDVCIGDIYQMGSVSLQVSSPRAPCNKISQRFGIKNLDRFVGQQGITGWYYRVLETGSIRVGDSVQRVFRPKHTVSVADLMRAVYDPACAQFAQHYSQLAMVDDEWRGKCAKIAAKLTDKYLHP